MTNLSRIKVFCLGGYLLLSLSLGFAVSFDNAKTDQELGSFNIVDASDTPPTIEPLAKLKNTSITFQSFRLAKLDHE